MPVWMSKWHFGGGGFRPNHEESPGFLMENCKSSTLVTLFTFGGPRLVEKCNLGSQSGILGTSKWHLNTSLDFKLAFKYQFGYQNGILGGADSGRIVNNRRGSSWKTVNCVPWSRCSLSGVPGWWKSATWDLKVAFWGHQNGI